MIYYNDNDRAAVEWLRDLIKVGRIPDGHVDGRSILDVQPEEIEGCGQCHFFAGIGGWPLALELAGWPDDIPVWTGSCPCQPFSIVGKGEGESDERHLWPEFRRLIEAGKPPVVFGEQVTSPLGRDWLAGVRADMEALGYEVGAADLCAAGVGAPHQRPRLYWVGIADSKRLCKGKQASEATRYGDTIKSTGCNGRMADAEKDNIRESSKGLRQKIETGGRGISGRMADGLEQGLQGRYGEIMRECPGEYPAWPDSTYVACRDGKARRIPIEPLLFPLAHGLPLSMGRMPPELRTLAEMAGLSKHSLKMAKSFQKTALQGSGNAIVPQLAAEFISATMEAIWT